MWVHQAVYELPQAPWHKSVQAPILQLCFSLGKPSIWTSGDVSILSHVLILDQKKETKEQVSKQCLNHFKMSYVLLSTFQGPWRNYVKNVGRNNELFVGPNDNALPQSQVFKHATPLLSRECQKAPGVPRVCGNTSGLTLSWLPGSTAERPFCQHQEPGC